MTMKPVMMGIRILVMAAAQYVLWNRVGNVSLQGRAVRTSMNATLTRAMKMRPAPTAMALFPVHATAVTQAMAFPAAMWMSVLMAAITVLQTRPAPTAMALFPARVTVVTQAMAFPAATLMSVVQTLTTAIRMRLAQIQRALLLVSATVVIAAMAFPAAMWMSVLMAAITALQTRPAPITPAVFPARVTVATAAMAFPAATSTNARQIMGAAEMQPTIHASTILAAHRLAAISFSLAGTEAQ